MTPDIKPFTPAQLAQISDENLKRALLRRENVELLETMLKIENERLNHLYQLEKEGKIDLGDPVTREEMQRIFKEEVKGKVEEFLDVHEMPFPKMEYFSLTGTRVGKIILGGYSSCMIATTLNPLYLPLLLLPAVIHYLERKDSTKGSAFSPLLREIIISRRVNEKDIPSTESHEYTHYIQTVLGVPSISLDIFEEGHACGVSRHVSRLISSKKRDKSFERMETHNAVTHMRHAYRWMSNQLGFTFNPYLFGKNEKINPKPDRYDFGNTLFYLAEAKHGPRIYANVLRGDFSSILGGSQQ